MTRFEPHPGVSDRYRISLTLSNGALLTYESYSEEHLYEWYDWIGSQKDLKINGRLIERITTLVID